MPYSLSLERRKPCMPGGGWSRSMGHFGLKQRLPFRYNLTLSRRHFLQTGSRLRPIFGQWSVVNYGSARLLPSRLGRSLALPDRFHTRRFFGGRQPLWGSGVTSSMALTISPAPCREVTADSRPEP